MPTRFSNISNLAAPRASSCHHPAVTSINGKDLEDQVFAVKEYCQIHGLRFTTLREQVYRLILLANKPIGAYELLAQLQSLHDKVVAPPTIYRSLDFLVSHGIIHQLSSINSFLPCCQPTGRHVAAFLICECCGDVEEINHLVIQDMMTQVAKHSKFSIDSSVIELSGLCLRCQVGAV